MKTRIVPVILSIILVIPLAAQGAQITGDYLEARTSDVYTGPCFANSEVNLVGKEALLAWHVREGEWQGVPLKGLSVVAVVVANDTLSEADPGSLETRSVILVDERATAMERQALVSFARQAAGRLLSEIVRVEAAPIRFQTGPRHGEVSLVAGETAELHTRSLHQGDHLCGNEEVYYPPLTEVAHAHPAVTEAHAFRGEGLGVTWSSPNKRSAFVGHFEF